MRTESGCPSTPATQQRMPAVQHGRRGRRALRGCWRCWPGAVQESISKIRGRHPMITPGLHTCGVSTHTHKTISLLKTMGFSDSTSGFSPSWFPVSPSSTKNHFYKHLYARLSLLIYTTPGWPKQVLQFEIPQIFNFHMTADFSLAKFIHPDSYIQWPDISIKIKEVQNLYVASQTQFSPSPVYGKIIIS